MGGDLARQANDCFSAAYDDFNSRYMNVQWTARLVERAEEAGLMTGRRLLDLGCGTGHSFIPMADRGWQVVACDVSPKMVEAARRKSQDDDRVELMVADMRELPDDLGEFDLIWSVNDAINYLQSADELEAALRGMRKCLAKGGAVLFDVNTLESYRTFFAEELTVEHNGRTLVWTGQVDPTQARPNMIAHAHFRVEGEPSSVHVHHQRHFPESVIRGALVSADLRLVAVYGELDGRLYDELDEDSHSKAVYVCCAGPSGLRLQLVPSLLPPCAPRGHGSK